MVAVLWVRLGCAVCALLLTWLTAHACCAQYDARQTMRGELAHFSLGNKGEAAPQLGVAAGAPRSRPWLIVAASTSAALAASYVVTSGFAYRATNDSTRAFERTHDFALDYSTRASAREQGGLAQQQAQLLSRMGDLFLASTVAATGATLLIWLTSKRARKEQQMRTLLGPMLLRGASGGGLVLREKF